MSGYTNSTDNVLRRMSRVEGQVCGTTKMVEAENYCNDVLIRVSAATKALESVALLVRGEHLSHCVAEAAAEGGPVAEEKIREANAAIARLVGS
ncbi:metal-sensing transcriptional repressor [Glaciibacter psychrotolerans]